MFDCAGPFVVTLRGNKYLIVIVDHFTKFFAIYTLKDMTAETIADVLVDYMCKYGLVESVLSDLGTNFMSQLLELIWELFDVRRLRTTAYHPECDGLSGRFIQTLKLMMTAYIDSEQ